MAELPQMGAVLSAFLPEIPPPSHRVQEPAVVYGKPGVERPNGRTAGPGATRGGILRRVLVGGGALVARRRHWRADRAEKRRRWSCSTAARERQRVHRPG